MSYRSRLSSPSGIFLPQKRLCFRQWWVGQESGIFSFLLVESFRDTICQYVLLLLRVEISWSSVELPIHHAGVLLQ